MPTRGARPGRNGLTIVSGSAPEYGPVLPAATGTGSFSVTLRTGGAQGVTATDINTTVFPLSYAWKSNGITVPGATASTFAVSNLSLSMNGDTYQVTVTDCAGSTRKTPATQTAKTWTESSARANSFTLNG